mmetsp:Transcript_6548/g.19417  ORF Transcript_6548/g.19417 Transcript_6548/m.19417 type:complete len:249 (+) Transcript_6548:394-1140(+)
MAARHIHHKRRRGARRLRPTAPIYEHERQATLGGVHERQHAKVRGVALLFSPLRLGAWRGHAGLQLAGGGPLGGRGHVPGRPRQGRHCGDPLPAGAGGEPRQRPRPRPLHRRVRGCGGACPLQGSGAGPRNPGPALLHPHQRAARVRRLRRGRAHAQQQGLEARARALRFGHAGARDKLHCHHDGLAGSHDGCVQQTLHDAHRHLPPGRQHHPLQQGVPLHGAPAALRLRDAGRRRAIWARARALARG